MEEFDWPPCWVDDAWVGASYLLSERPEALAIARAASSRIGEPTPDIGCPEPDTVLDWLHALECARKPGGLVRKPLATWTIADLAATSATLTARAGGDGSLRSTWTDSPIHEPTDTEWAAVEALQARGWSNLEAFERATIFKHYEDFQYSFAAPPHAIESRVASALAEAVAACETARGATEIVRLVARLGFAIGTTHPFADGHRRLVRLVIGAVCVQLGLSPVRCTGDMLGALTASARAHADDAFVRYVEACALEGRAGD